MNRLERQKIWQKVTLYPVTSQEHSLGKTNLEVTKILLDTGIKVIQLREKNWSDSQLISQATQLRSLTTPYQCLLFINDRIDIALACDADGVHLGQNDISIPFARKIAPAMLLGLSCHSTQDLLNAQRLDVDYVNIGPIFPTATKQTTSLPLGAKFIQDHLDLCTTSFSVMGGITLKNIDQVLVAGARKIAMITGVVQQKNIKATATQLLQKITSFL